MQVFIRKLTGNPYILPLLVVAICIWRIFMPQLPANAGLGWDGYNYYSLTVNGFESEVLNSYLVLRILPCLLIHILFKLLSISFEPANVILAFKIMNTVLIGLSALMVKRIFDQYKLSPASQLTGFVLVFLNYGVIVFTYYYPVMTDTPAFFLSVALFYFFVRGELSNVFLTGLIGAFTWPLLLAMAFALILFAKTENKVHPLPKGGLFALGMLCAGYAIAVSWYFVIYKEGKAEDLFTLPIGTGMLPVAFLFTGLLYYFMSYLLDNRTFFDFKYYRSVLDGNRIFALLALTVVFLLVRSSLKVNAPSEFLSPFTQIEITMVYAFQRPLIALVSHFNYFGCVLLLCILFWKEISAYFTSFGLGVAGVIFISLFLFFAQAESRRLVYFFPWIMIIVSLFLGKYEFKKTFYLLIFVFNFALAKLWLFFDYAPENALLKDGTITFPNQWFFMHLGRWMTEYVWLWLCITLIISLLLFIVNLYKIEFTKKEIAFYRKYKPLSYE